METRKIGALDVSVIGLGCNNFGRRLDASGTAAVVKAALEAGITLFDTADVYGSGQSEQYLSRALGARRKDVIIATKFGNQMEGQGRGASPAYIKMAVEASLSRLGTDYIDLYQVHVPDAETPIQETLGALNELVQAGKVREIGCSNFSIDQLRTAAAAVKPGGARFASVQNEFSLLKRDPEREILAECQRQGIAFLPYFPLASGLLTGKYRQGQPLPQGTRISGDGPTARWLTEANLAAVEALVSFAEGHGHSVLDLAFAWLLTRPAVVSVIAGAMTPAQVQANAATHWRLTETELAEIDSIAPWQARA